MIERFHGIDRHKKYSTIVCYILDPHKFRIIKDSWKKTDKYDARNMVKALWVYLVTGEFGIPCVYKPSAVTRELRKLFSQYGLLNRQIRMLKNNIQAILMNKLSLNIALVCFEPGRAAGCRTSRNLAKPGSILTLDRIRIGSFTLKLPTKSSPPLCKLLQLLTLLPCDRVASPGSSSSCFQRAGPRCDTRSCP